MSDDAKASTNLTQRGAIWHFCLRVPTDLVPHVGKGRIQFTLNTSVESEAKRRALPHLEHWHKRFAELRSGNGLIAETPNAGALDTTGWTWPDWEALVSWLEARLLEDDLQKRLRDAKGSHFSTLLKCLASVASSWREHSLASTCLSR
jgi:hypothetical protein